MPFKWDLRFLEMAKLVSTWSKDPSTKVGAVIVRPDRSVLSMGFNGFPRKFGDYLDLYENREEKYSRIIHAEVNALIQARGPVDGCTLYTWPFLCCDRCAVQVIQAGIVRVVAPFPAQDAQLRWNKAFQKAREFFREAEVECLELA